MGPKQDTSESIGYFSPLEGAIWGFHPPFSDKAVTCERS